jgi:hypothetical protein
MSHHWCPDPSLLHDFTVSAQKSADATGQYQIIHFHMKHELCDEAGHLEVQPDLARHRAIRGGNGKTLVFSRPNRLQR